MNGKIFLLLVLAGVLVVGCVNPLDAKPNSSSGEVARVIDGDTIQMANNDTVRLIGWDFPDITSDRIDKWTVGLNLSRNVVVGCYYSGNALAKSKLEGKSVLLVSSSTEPDKDQYGRLLRYVSLDGMDFGLFMLKQGYGVEYDPSQSKACENCGIYSESVADVKNASAGCLWGGQVNGSI